MHQWFLDFYDPPTKQKEQQQLPISFFYCSCRCIKKDQDSAFLKLSESSCLFSCGRCKPDVETFNALMNAHGRAGQWRWALNIFDDMIRAAVSSATLYLSGSLFLLRSLMNAGLSICVRGPVLRDGLSLNRMKVLDIVFSCNGRIV
jgi:pentatricopeptide repeat protein